jgi:hydrogenase maturation protease
VKEILIGGIGNVLLGDDGVGPYIARLLAAHYEFEDGVEVADLGTPALDLIDQISGKDAVILIDSIDANDTGAVPGTVLLYRKADIMRHTPAMRMDPHSPALVDALLSAELFAVAPRDLLLVGIKAECYEAGCSLSKPVNTALDQAIAEVLVELDRLGVSYRRRQHPGSLGIWWTADEKTESRGPYKTASTR